jgi:hypothetical protein
LFLKQVLADGTWAVTAQLVQRLALGWTVWGSNPGVGKIFRTHPDYPWGLRSLPYNRYQVFPGGKVAGAWGWPPTPSSTKVKERVGIYLYTPYGPSWPDLGSTLPLPYIYKDTSFFSIYGTGLDKFNKFICYPCLNYIM